MSNPPWPSLLDRISPSLTTTAIPITSPTGALLGDWREPILRMLRSHNVKMNIRISDKLPTSFSSGYSGHSLPSTLPVSSNIIGSPSPTPQQPTLGIQIPGASQGSLSPSLSSYKTARSTPFSQRSPVVELSPRSPAPLSLEPPILPTPASNVAPPTQTRYPHPSTTSRAESQEESPWRDVSARMPHPESSRVKARHSVGNLPTDPDSDDEGFSDCASIVTRTSQTREGKRRKLPQRIFDGVLRHGRRLSQQANASMPNLPIYGVSQ